MATTAPAPSHDRTQDRIAATLTSLQSDMARAEGKASLLLALSGAVLVALVSTVKDLHLPAPAVAVGAVGGAALLASTVLLLLAVRPDLGGPGWPSWSRLTREELNDCLARGYRVEHLRYMAALARRKFLLLRVAVDCLLGGLGLLAAAVVLSWTL
ncbi:DUF5706 domain-containing protein [Streptomyces sp. NBC_00006]|uniref:Pycsar system effector family protein n=1 Tax=Streptomyces sp. NBC_00006 TaxID=2975619 RepID=UPI002253E427|nr:Pycsar system effector family protein [Streptomyces sp. NBC_00006]MCX5529839.1 DUF5706 domain-containing protein [Streptomyces sp. NBC_00006]